MFLRKHLIFNSSYIGTDSSYEADFIFLLENLFVTQTISPIFWSPRRHYHDPSLFNPVSTL